MGHPVIPSHEDLMKCGDSFVEKISAFSSALLASLNGLEKASRQFYPPVLSEIRDALVPFKKRQTSDWNSLKTEAVPPGFEYFFSLLEKTLDHSQRALTLFTEYDEVPNPVLNVMKAMRQLCRAQEVLFPLRRTILPINRYFLEPPIRNKIDGLDPEEENGNNTGLYPAESDDFYARGDFSLYVPESYDGSTEWPLVVALHGGHGHGRDFIWMWIREARSRGFLLLAPTSVGNTWSFQSDEDGERINRRIERICFNWRVDTEKILLTGMSDGAIYSLTWGLRKNSIFAAVAAVSGVLHPIDLNYVQKKRVYIVHGTLDWMFPVSHAHQAYGILKSAGADVTFHEIEDLSHTYPREENIRMLEWFDPELAI